MDPMLFFMAGYWLRAVLVRWAWGERWTLIQIYDKALLLFVCITKRNGSEEVLVSGAIGSEKKGIPKAVTLCGIGGPGQTKLR